MSPIRKVAALLDHARKKSDIISFGGGAPSVPPLPELIEEFNRLLTTDPLRTCAYTGTRGIPELREAVAEDARKYGRIDFNPATEITLTTGATEAIFAVLMSLVNEGDEVIVTDPAYLGYKEMIELAQGSPKRLPVTVDHQHQLDIEGLKQVVSKRTKAVMVLSPDNPTGRIVKEEFVKCLIDLAQDYDFWIISDGIYKHMVYEGEHIWISGYPNARERTITVCSFSKEAGIPGLRIGYTLAPSQAIDRMEKMQQYSTLAPDTLAQFGLVKFLRTDMKETYLKNKVLPVYMSRRKVMGEMLARFLPEARTVTPQGAFYYFVGMRPYPSKLQISEEEFAERLLKEKSVAVIPGRFFGENGKGHVRVTFVSENEDRIGRGVEEMFNLASRKPS